MSAFDIRESLERAEKRLGKLGNGLRRQPRSDRGISRLKPKAFDCLVRVASGMERPRMMDMLSALASICARNRVAAPSRATVYKLLDKLPVPSYELSDLPGPVKGALYNLGPGSEVPAHQLAFYCFNYGTLEAVSFAAGLPWLAIYQALRLPGYRERSRGLALAVARVRGI